MRSAFLAQTYSCSADFHDLPAPKYLHLSNTTEHMVLFCWDSIELTHGKLKNLAFLLLGLDLCAHNRQLALRRDSLLLDLLQDLGVSDSSTGSRSSWTYLSQSVV